MKFPIIKEWIFSTHGQDTKLNKYTGMKIMEILDADKNNYDLENVGAMYDIILENGVKINAFEDEIIPLLA